MEEKCPNTELIIDLVIIIDVLKSHINKHTDDLDKLNKKLKIYGII